MNYMVDFPTRISDYKESAIDNFLTDIPTNKLKIVGLITELSDHDGQILDTFDTKNK